MEPKRRGETHHGLRRQRRGLGEHVPGVKRRVRGLVLGGALPARRTAAPVIAVPPLASYGQFALQADGKEMSTTMAAVRNRSRA